LDAVKNVRQIRTDHDLVVRQVVKPRRLRVERRRKDRQKIAESRPNARPADRLPSWSADDSKRTLRHADAPQSAFENARRLSTNERADFGKS
jgi:hypothetical protein